MYLILNDYDNMFCPKMLKCYILSFCLLHVVNTSFFLKKKMLQLGFFLKPVKVTSIHGCMGDKKKTLKKNKEI
jgi:hypothetical protein